MVAVERLLEYANDSFPMEPSGALIDPPASWPSSGALSFENVCVVFQSGKKVLKHVSFAIPGACSLGVVGRTGAGKSTIINCLLRLVPFEGCIRIDGVDISKVALQRLRSAVAVIPQESVIFAGTLRRNLDPSKQVSDDDIKSIMREMRLDSMLDNLDEPVAELSQGQIQLLCIARAAIHMMQGGKILVSDESTASIDTATDQLCQQFLEKFLRYL